MFTEVCKRLDRLNTEVDHLRKEVKEIRTQQQQILDLLKVNKVHELLNKRARS